MIKCEIVTPYGIYKVFDTKILNVVTIDGERGILKRHTPLVTMLKISKMSTIEDGKRKEYAISGGLLYFENDKARILTDAIESKDEIDLERALNSKERAQERMNSGIEIDYLRAELSLKRAINRIDVKNG